MMPGDPKVWTSIDYTRGSSKLKKLAGTHIECVQLRIDHNYHATHHQGREFRIADWDIKILHKAGLTDKKGWEYASAFSSSSWGGTAHANRFVRRRVLKVKTQTQSDDAPGKPKTARRLTAARLQQLELSHTGNTSHAI